MLDLAFVPAAAGLPSLRSPFISRTSLNSRASFDPPALCAHVREPCHHPEPATAVAEESLSAAEKTRRALSESKPLVKFRRDTEYLDERTDFAYTKGVESGVDIWLITGILTFLVPLVGFAIGVATGNIDVTPR